MKKFLLFIMVIGLSSCEFYYLEPVFDSRERIIGSYDVDEYSNTYNDETHYSIWIERSYNSDEIIIHNFYGVDIDVRAIVDYNNLTIYRQVIDGYDVEGVGTIYSGRIEFSYRVKDLYTGSRTDYCSTTAWR